MMTVWGLIEPHKPWHRIVIKTMEDRGVQASWRKSVFSGLTFSGERFRTDAAGFIKRRAVLDEARKTTGRKAFDVWL